MSWQTKVIANRVLYTFLPLSYGSTATYDWQD